MSALAPTVDELSKRNLEKLPALAYAVIDGNPRGARIVLVEAGKKGASITTFDDPSEPIEQVHKYVNKINCRIGVSPRESTAMLAGAVHGWHVDAADPDTYKTH